jgi:hypothetical protein
MGEGAGGGGGIPFPRIKITRRTRFWGSPGESLRESRLHYLLYLGEQANFGIVLMNAVVATLAALAATSALGAPHGASLHSGRAAMPQLQVLGETVCPR